MKQDTILRIARPTDNLTSIAEMYSMGLGFNILGQFTDHDGFDGIILGNPDEPYHIEFTTQKGHKAGGATSEEHLLVFYIPDKTEWENSCIRMLKAGFREVTSNNPYWDQNGKTFEDIDGYRVVMQNTAWPVSGK